MKHNISVHLCDLPHEDVDDNGGFRDAAGTVTFTYEGTRYNLDVCDEHQTELRKTFEELIAAAQTQRLAGSTTTASRRQADQIRKWAAANGYSLPTRGRIPSKVKDAFAAAGPEAKAS